jgi:antitoxin component YwqK of YwqJK toxin-antitoxin module
MKRYLLIATIIFILSGCDRDHSVVKKNIAKVNSPVSIPSLIVNSTDTSLQLINGIWFYRHKLFSGTMETYFVPGVIKARQTFYHGKDEGLLCTFYENGNKDAERFYHNGEKDSTNKGWWINGNPRFEYHFKNGVYEGDFKEWYVSGKPLKHIIYQDGKEQSGKGWRENGKVYMSFVTRDGRLYGLNNPNLCYSLKNERGEFINSSP